jgi:hypothetical protein
MREMENQLEWVRSEKDEQIAKLSAEKKNLQVRLSDAESQLSMVKAQKREELKVEVVVAISNICVQRYVYADQNKLFVCGVYSHQLID